MLFIKKIQSFFKNTKDRTATGDIRDANVSNDSRNINVSSSSSASSQHKTIHGRLRYYNAKRGYGFIKSQQTDVDVFVHHSDMRENLRKGNRVEFEVEQTDKGLKAKNVRLLQTAQAN